MRSVLFLTSRLQNNIHPQYVMDVARDDGRKHVYKLEFNCKYWVLNEELCIFLICVCVCVCVWNDYATTCLFHITVIRSTFLSLIFPPAVYHGHVLLPVLLGNERLIWSVAHLNGSWNMSKRAWVHEFAWLNTTATRTSYTECPRRNVPDFGRVFLTLKYTDITQNNYIQSWTVTEIMAREVWKFDSCYTLIVYQIHIKTGRNMLFL